MSFKPDLYRRDSIAKCDSSYDIYSVIRNPNMPPPSRVEITVVDVMETEQEKLERQAILRFREGHFRFMQQDGSALKLIALLGKYGFVVITLPPYLLFYGLPEWILMQFLPKIFRKGQKQIKKVPDMIGRMMSWMPSKADIISKIIKPFAPLKHYLEDFLKMMKRSSQAVRSALLYAAMAPVRLAAYPFVKAKEKIEKAVEKVQQGLQNIVKAGEKIKEKVKEAVETVEKGWNHVTTYVKQIAQPVIDWSAAKIDFAKHTVQKGVNWLGATAYKAAEKVKEKLMPPIEKTVEMANRAIEFGYWAAKPVVDWVKHKTGQFNAQIKAKTSAVRDYFSRQASYVRELVMAPIQTAVDYTKAVVPFLYNFFSDASQGLIKALIPSPVRKWFRAKKEGRRRSMGQMSKEFFSDLGRGASFIASKAVQSIKKKALAKMKNTAGWLQLAFQGLARFIKQLPALFIRFMKRLGIQVVRGAKALRHFSRVAWVSIKVLTRLAVQLLRELAAELGHWLTATS